MVSEFSRLLDPISSSQEDDTPPPPRLETVTVLALPAEIVYLEGADDLPLAAIAPNDDQGFLDFALLDDLSDNVINVLDTYKRCVLSIPPTIFVLQLSGLVVIAETVQVVTEGSVNALLKHVLAYNVSQGMEDCLHLLIGDSNSVCDVADMILSNQRPGFRPSGLESSASLDMTIKIEGVFGEVMAALDTTVDTNFLLLLWLTVRQFVARKITPLH